MLSNWTIKAINKFANDALKFYYPKAVIDVIPKDRWAQVRVNYKIFCMINEEGDIYSSWQHSDSAQYEAGRKIGNIYSDKGGTEVFTEKGLLKNTLKKRKYYEQK